MYNDVISEMKAKNIPQVALLKQFLPLLLLQTFLCWRPWAIPI